jgi:hypothetical protein
LTIFVFERSPTGDLELVARTGSIRARGRVTSDADHAVVVTASETSTNVLEPRELQQLAARPGLEPIIRAAASLVQLSSRQTLIPLTDAGTWTLGRVELQEWSGNGLAVSRAATHDSELQRLELHVARFSFDADFRGYLDSRSDIGIGELQRHAIDERLNALQELTSNEDGGPAQAEILRLTRVTAAAEELLADKSLDPSAKQRLATLLRACETTTATMSASLTAALLAAQHNTDRSESKQRKAVELAQQRIAATAAALVLPSLVMGYAGANFVVPAPDDRLWIALLTTGVALLAGVIGAYFAYNIGSIRTSTTKSAARFLALSGAALCMAGALAIVFDWR